MKRGKKAVPRVVNSAPGYDGGPDADLHPGRTVAATIREAGRCNTAAEVSEVLRRGVDPWTAALARSLNVDLSGDSPEPGPEYELGPAPGPVVSEHPAPIKRARRAKRAEVHERDHQAEKDRACALCRVEHVAAHGEACTACFELETLGAGAETWSVSYGSSGVGEFDVPYLESADYQRDLEN